MVDVDQGAGHDGRHDRTAAEPGRERFALDVLRIDEGKVAEIVTFSGSALAPLGLPETL